MKKNKLGIIIALVAILIIVLVTYGVIKSNSKFNPKNLKIEAGTELSSDVNYYLENSVKFTSQYKLDLSKVNTMVNGDYIYTIRHLAIKKKGTITIEDTTPPIVKVRDAYIEAGERVNVSDLIITYTDITSNYGIRMISKMPVTILDNPGTYKIEYAVVDSSDNETICTSNIYVYENGALNDIRSKDLNYEYNSSSDKNLNLDDIESKYYLKLDKAIKSNDYEAFIKVYSDDEINNFIKNKYSNYEYKDLEYIVIFNKYYYTIGFVERLVLQKDNNVIDVYLKKEDIN